MKLITAVSATIAGAAVPAVLFVGAGTTYAAPDSKTVQIQDSTERPATTIRGIDLHRHPRLDRPCRVLIVNGILVCDS